MRTRALLAALTVTLALATASPAVADQEQATRILWTQVLDDEFTTARIVSARPDGSGLRALIHPAAGEFDLNAVISPDGSRVVFERDLADGSAQIHVVGATAAENTPSTWAVSTPAPPTSTPAGPQTAGASPSPR